MGFFSRLFKKKTLKYQIDKKNEDNLVVMLCPKNKIKLNEIIVVPENFCAVFLSKEKLLDEIPAGEFEIGGLTCPKVCKINKLDKPTKKGYKTEFNADFYFVNLKENLLENSFTIKKGGYDVSLMLLFNIENVKKFLEFLICEQICFENDYAQNELKFYVSKLIYYYILDNKILNVEKLIEYVKTKLKSVGVNLIKLDLTILCDGEDLTKDVNSEPIENEDINNIISKDSTEEEFNLDYSKKLDESLQLKPEKESFSKKSIVSLDDIQTQNLTYFVCENCGTKLPKDTKLCFVCGKSFVEKNLCENCGKEICKTDYVCPHCGSVVIQN